jgi:recombination protein U
MNSGKKFETNFKNSVPDNIFFYRFRDGTSSWSKQENTRFQAKNICDCMMYDGQYLYLLELKSHKGESLPLSAIRENQVKDLLSASKHENVIAGLIVNFADKEQVYFMDIGLAEKWYNNGIRKSIPLSEFKESCIEIQATKLKTNYRYDIDRFIKDVVKK